MGSRALLQTDDRSQEAPQQAPAPNGEATLPAAQIAADLALQRRTTETGEALQIQEKTPRPETPSAAADPSAADGSRTMESGGAAQGVQEKAPHPATPSGPQPCESNKKNPRSKKRPGPTSARVQRKKPRTVQKTAAPSTMALEPLAPVAGDSASGGEPPLHGRRVRRPAARAMNNPE